MPLQLSCGMPVTCINQIHFLKTLSSTVKGCLKTGGGVGNLGPWLDAWVKFTLVYSPEQLPNSSIDYTNHTIHTRKSIGLVQVWRHIICHKHMISHLQYKKLWFFYDFPLILCRFRLHTICVHILWFYNFIPFLEGCCYCLTTFMTWHYQCNVRIIV